METPDELATNNICIFDVSVSGLVSPTGVGVGLSVGDGHDLGTGQTHGQRGFTGDGTGPGAAFPELPSGPESGQMVEFGGESNLTGSVDSGVGADGSIGDGD